MDSRKLVACATRLHHRQAAYLTFATNGINGLRRLLTQQGQMTVDQNQIVFLMAVAQSGEWQQISKTVMVWNLHKVAPTILEAIAKDVESISAGDHILKGIFTGSQRKKEGAYQDFLSILSPAFCHEMGGWGVKIDPRIVEINELPVVQLNIQNKETSSHLFTLVIDGFSGRCGIQKGISQVTWGEHRFTGNQTVRDWVKTQVIEYLEDATAAA